MLHWAAASAPQPLRECRSPAAAGGAPAGVHNSSSRFKHCLLGRSAGGMARVQRSPSMAHDMPHHLSVAAACWHPPTHPPASTALAALPGIGSVPTYLHGAQLGGEGAAHPASDDDGCHHRGQLPRERQSQHAPHCTRETQLRKLPAGRRAGQAGRRAGGRAGQAGRQGRQAGRQGAVWWLGWWPLGCVVHPPPPGAQGCSELGPAGLCRPWF